LLYLEIEAPTLTYAQLGYAETQIEQLIAASNTPSGTIIFAGVTGSGKTTTLKTFIETHPGNGNDAFYSIEDPVEYPLRGVHQIPIQRDLIDRAGSAAKYAEVVAGLMRADPGCVLMGEIRDPATAISAQQIVETGHMACGTVHAHLISGIIPRLTNDEIGMSRDVLTNPNMLTLLVYQALVPKLCPHCRISASDLPASMPDLKNITRVCDTLEKRFYLSRTHFHFKRIGGCGKCNHRGTDGPSVVAEILTPDRRWLNLIRQSKDFEGLMYYRSQSDGDFKSPNMDGKTVFEHCLFKAIHGEVDPRNCERFDSFARFEIKTARDRENAALHA
jgi:type II secretory ATPase GspE/PulE/Tfp pilus assembly ATPase PilB-like protein